MEAEKTSIEPTVPQPAPSSTDAIQLVLSNNDLLGKILLLLGFPTLLHVILVSKRWLWVASDPAFLRRFRQLHPPRLLGFYIEAWPSPYFIPHPQQDKDLAAVVVHPGPFESGKKSIDISDFINGRLLLNTFHLPVELTVYSPLHPEPGSVTILPSKPDVDGDLRLGCVCCIVRLLPEDGGDGMSCTEVKVICNIGSRQRVWVQVSDLEAGIWGKVRSSEPIELPENMLPYPKRKEDIPQDFISQFGKLYVFCMRGHILGINLLSMSLFCIKLPDDVKYNGEGRLGLSRANGAGIYLVQLDMFKIHVWLYSTATCSTSDNWKLVDTISLWQALGDLADPIWYIDGFMDYLVAVGDNADFVFVKVLNKFFYMHISSRKVEKVYELPQQHRSISMKSAYPLMTPWPPTFPALNDSYYQD